MKIIILFELQSGLTFKLGILHKMLSSQLTQNKCSISLYHQYHCRYHHHHYGSYFNREEETNGRGRGSQKKGGRGWDKLNILC